MPSGQPDNSYLNTNLMFQAMYAARYISAQMTSQYIVPGKILVANGTLIPPGSIATTPNAMLATVIAVYAYLASEFIVPERADLRAKRLRARPAPRVRC